MLLRRVVGVCDSCVFVGGWSVFISVVCGWFVFAWRERMVIVWIGRLRSRPRAAHPKVEVLRSRPEAVHPRVEHSRSNDRAARARARGRARAGRRAVGRRGCVAWRSACAVRLVGGARGAAGSASASCLGVCCACALVHGRARGCGGRAFSCACRALVKGRVGARAARWEGVWPAPRGARPRRALFATFYLKKSFQKIKTHT